MRIISGKYKSRSIKAPSSKFTRPTTDIVKETIFNILQNRIEIEGLKVLDIYAGSGSLGLEALSRGAAEVHFVEMNFSVFKVLLNNIKNLEAEDSCRIFKKSALKFTQTKEHETYDLIFADPPFFEYDIHTVYKNIIGKNFLKDDGIFLIERSIQTEKQDAEGFGINPFKKIGDSLIYWFEK
ncbi:16s rrna (guanine(966)-n(2))-methyltransferase ssu rrna m(2)g966 [hydrocarbon metagenome]|uniref:16s rrna (Guanine(966)-n(2))-methyltransferase ssu rrna m(2)g966 n=1 Tax=hydrocarbon metagenome TaxID=938273 RepID=A0A0W8G0M1_9ZZZZ